MDKRREGTGDVGPNSAEDQGARNEEEANRLAQKARELSRAGAPIEVRNGKLYKGINRRSSGGRQLSPGAPVVGRTWRYDWVEIDEEGNEVKSESETE